LAAAAAAAAAAADGGTHLADVERYLAGATLAPAPHTGFLPLAGRAFRGGTTFRVLGSGGGCGGGGPAAAAATVARLPREDCARLLLVVVLGSEPHSTSRLTVAVVKSLSARMSVPTRCSSCSRVTG